MKRRLVFLLLFLPAALLCAAAESLPAALGSPVRRFALVAGSNEGGAGRARLRYAESDARAFAAVLGELGGVRSEDLVIIVSPDLPRFQDAIRRIRSMVVDPRNAAERRELVVYYSGHSDEDGLILGSDHYAWDAFRRDITGVPADVKIAILDSCASGSLTRAKGGVSRPAFLFDASTDMKGHAFLTSSSAEEAAQESDRIGASFFTHFLVSGLRGAADSAGDGLVTLNEAYAYAFQETLASTERTQYGPQHPAYDISLTGSGDLVLTDLRHGEAGLTVAEDVIGRLYIRDGDGALAVELNKTEARRVDLMLPPGPYSAILDRKGVRSGVDIRVSGRQRATLSLASLHALQPDRTTARGGTAAAVSGPGGTGLDAPPVPSAASERGAFFTALDMLPFSLSFIPNALGGMFARHGSRPVSVNILVGLADSSNGFEIGGLVNIESGAAQGFQAAGLGNIVFGDVSGFQGGGLVNFSGGRTSYFQGAGLVNASMGDVRGFQGAGLVNACFGSLSGCQSAGLANVTLGDTRGAQLAGVANWSRGALAGAQVAGVVNVGSRVTGPQISVINIAGDVSGVQLGVINIAGDVKGVQVGVLNFSRNVDGVPIGLLSFVEKGRHSLSLWWDMEGTTNACFALGANELYTVFVASWTPDSDPVSWSYGMGFGTRATLGRLYLDVDIALLAMMTGSEEWYAASYDSYMPRLRAVIGLPIFDALRIEAGVAIRAYIPGLYCGPYGVSLVAPQFVPSFIVGFQL